MALDQYVAQRVRILRREYRLTQEQLAEIANIDISSIAKIERGERSNIKINTLEKIIEAFNLSVENFFMDYEKESGIDILDPSFEKFKKSLLLVPDEKRKEYLQLFEAIINVGR
ncbi:helix-turn-helix domain-containing protein [Streptococcus rifensis]